MDSWAKSDRRLLWLHIRARHVVCWVSVSCIAWRQRGLDLEEDVSVTLRLHIDLRLSDFGTKKGTTRRRSVFEVFCTNFFSHLGNIYNALKSNVFRSIFTSIEVCSYGPFLKIGFKFLVKTTMTIRTVIGNKANRGRPTYFSQQCRIGTHDKLFSS